MEQLVEALKKAQATSFAFYLKAHNFHWNVEGSNFAEYHEFLGDLYAEVFGAVDAIAEHCRTLDAYVPGSFSRFQQLSSIDDELSVPSGRVRWPSTALRPNFSSIGEISSVLNTQVSHPPPS